MLHLNQTYEFLNGGYYVGDSKWHKPHAEIDNCFKIFQHEVGETSIVCDGQSHTLKSNRLYFINGFKIESQSCKHSFETFWVHFIPRDIVTYHYLQELPPFVELPYDPTLSNLHAMTKSSVKETSFRDSFLIKLHFQHFLEKIVLNLLSMHNSVEREPVSTLLRIKPAIDYIYDNYKNIIKLDDLAEICNMSTNHFHKLFKLTLNITPANFQTVLRMNAALHMLSWDVLPIKEIASVLGFVDNAHFSKTFKTHFGFSPKDYRTNEKMKNKRLLETPDKPQPVTKEPELLIL